MAKLTAEERKNLPDSAFVFPKDRGYPIHDENHAIDALSRSSGTPQYAAVRNAVHRRFPDIKQHPNYPKGGA